MCVRRVHGGAQVCLLKSLKLGQLHVMMVWLQKPRRSGVADALHSANSNTRSSGFKSIPWCPYSALLAPQLLRKCGQRNVHFPRGKHTFCQRPRSRKGGGVADAVHSANSNTRPSGFKYILLLFNRMTPPTTRFPPMTPPITRE